MWVGCAVKALKLHKYINKGKLLCYIGNFVSYLIEEVGSRTKNKQTENIKFQNYNDEHCLQYNQYEHVSFIILPWKQRREILNHFVYILNYFNTYLTGNMKLCIVLKFPAGNFTHYICKEKKTDLQQFSTRGTVANGCDCKVYFLFLFSDHADLVLKLLVLWLNIIFISGQYSCPFQTQQVCDSKIFAVESDVQRTPFRGTMLVMFLPLPQTTSRCKREIFPLKLT